MAFKNFNCLYLCQLIAAFFLTFHAMVTASKPTAFNAEYIATLANLPSGLFNVLHLRDLGLISVEKKYGVECPTAYLPLRRFDDFITGESHRGSHPLDPFDRLFSVSSNTKNPKQTPFPISRSFKCVVKFCGATFSVGDVMGPNLAYVPIRLRNYTHSGHCTSECENMSSWNMNNPDGLPCGVHNEVTGDKLKVHGASPQELSRACKSFLLGELSRYPDLPSDKLKVAWLEHYHSFNPPPMVCGQEYPRKDDLVSIKDINALRTKCKEQMRMAKDVVTSLDNYTLLNPLNVPFRHDSKTLECAYPGCIKDATHGPKVEGRRQGEGFHCLSHAPSGHVCNEPTGTFLQPLPVVVYNPYPLYSTTPTLVFYNPYPCIQQPLPLY